MGLSNSVKTCNVRDLIIMVGSAAGIAAADGTPQSEVAVVVDDGEGGIHEVDEVTLQQHSDGRYRINLNVTLTGGSEGTWTDVHTEALADFVTRITALNGAKAVA